MTGNRVIIRERYLDMLRAGEGTPFVKVLTGIRRCGKSTLMRMFVDDLVSRGVDAGSIICMDFDLDPDSVPAGPSDLLARIRESLVPGPGTYVFLDEVQNVKGWETAVLSLYTAGADVYITGSNSEMLSSDIATRLSGRCIEIRVRPLVFSEYVLFRESSGKSVDHLLDEFLSDGGMPAVASSEDSPAKRLIPQMLEGMFATVYSTDIIDREGIRNPAMLHNIIRFLMRNIGNRTSSRRIANYLSSKGQRIAVSTVEEYLRRIESAFLLTRSERVDPSTMECLSTTDKFYASDLGMRNAVIREQPGDRAMMIENIVFNELLFRYGSAATADVNGNEVDFVAGKGDAREYFQVCVSLADGETLERELRSLRAIKDSYPKTVITYERHPATDIDGIRVVRLADWLLG